MPLFSAVVPVYKIRQYLPKCVESLLSQTYENIEIILVDDGSPDDCGALCDSYGAKDSRVKVVHKENGGLVSARQAGAAVATGDYVACIDGDDWVAPDYFEKFAKVLEKHPVDMVCCGYYNAYEDKNVPQPKAIPNGYYDRERIEKELFPMLIERADGLYFYPSLWAKAFKREQYVKLQSKVDPAMYIGEDVVCTKPLVYGAQSLYLMEDVLYYYRQNPASMTKDGRAFSWDIPYQVRRHLEREIAMDQGDFQAQVYRRMVHDLFIVSVSQFNRKEGYRKTVREIARHLDDPYCAEAIKNCAYGNYWKGRLAELALRHRWYFAMWLFHKR